jgi:hypothetical protein
MSTLFARCPFSRVGCVECPIYRGRHCFIMPTEGRERAASIRKEDEGWQEGLAGFFNELDEQSRRCIDSFSFEDSL